jgi:hypothetical protein
MKVLGTDKAQMGQPFGAWAQSGALSILVTFRFDLRVMASAIERALATRRQHLRISTPLRLLSRPSGAGALDRCFQAEFR